MAGTYIQTGATTYTEIAGTKGVYAQTGASTYTQVKQIYVQTGASTYTLVYQYDVTPPTGGGVSSLVWNQALPGFTVNYNSTADAASGLASYTLQLDTGSGYANVSSINSAGGSYSHTVTSGNRGVLHNFRTVAVDNVGNTTTSSATSRYAKPLGTFYVTAADFSTWGTATSGTGSPAGWRTDLGALSEIHVGWINTTYAYQYGYWFYGSGVENVAKGYSPDSGTIRTYRSNSLGCSGTVVWFATHNHGTKPTTPSTSLTYYSGTTTEQTIGNSQEFVLSAASLGRIGTDTTFGMFMYPGQSGGAFNSTQQTSCASGSTYKVFDSPFADANSGRLTLVYT